MTPEQEALLDRSYVERWAHELGVLDLWHEIAELLNEIVDQEFAFETTEETREVSVAPAA